LLPHSKTSTFQNFIFLDRLIVTQPSKKRNCVKNTIHLKYIFLPFKTTYVDLNGIFKNSIFKKIKITMIQIKKLATVKLK